MELANILNELEIGELKSENFPAAAWPQIQPFPLPPTAFSARLGNRSAYILDPRLISRTLLPNESA